MWLKSTDGYGWTTYKRGNCRIVESPLKIRFMLYAPGCTTEHPSLGAAKRAAETRRDRGW
jgi:hypothetical protein